MIKVRGKMKALKMKIRVRRKNDGIEIYENIKFDIDYINSWNAPTKSKI